MKNILVTGATGYLGSSLISTLAKNNSVNVTLVYRSNEPVLTGSKNIAAARYEDVLTGRYSLRQIDVICHLGAPRTRQTAHELPQAVVDARLIMERAVEAQVRAIIFASSQAVYGASHPVWYESTAAAPVTPHGLTKLAIEELLKIGRRLGMVTLSLRLPKLIGPGHRMKFTHTEMMHVLALALIKKEQVTFPQSFLMQRLDLLDVRDASDIIARICAEDTAFWPQTLNVGKGETTTGAEIVSIADKYSVEQYGTKVRISVTSDRIERRRFGMNVESMRKFIGEVPFRSMNETFSDVVKYLSASNLASKE